MNLTTDGERVGSLVSSIDLGMTRKPINVYSHHAAALGYGREEAVQDAKGYEGVEAIVHGTACCGLYCYDGEPEQHRETTEKRGESDHDHSSRTDHEHVSYLSMVYGIFRQVPYPTKKEKKGKKGRNTSAYD